ncbi:MAG: endolytic transglycosylase MltG [Raoultibacter sp.]
MPAHKRVTYSEHPNHAARSAHARGERQFKTYDTTHIRPRKSPAPIIVSLVLVLVVLVALGFGAMTMLKGCSADPGATGMLEQGKQVQVNIAEGSGAKQVGEALKEAGVIASVDDFTKQVASSGLESSLMSGAYSFTGGMTLEEVIGTLKAGPMAQAGLVIPEGYTLAKTAAKVAEAYPGTISAQDFTAAAHNAAAYVADYPFVADAYDNSLEGFLFPKTYKIVAGATADTVVRQMLDQYEIETASLDYTHAQSQGLSAYDVLKMASVVEKEAAPDNRATVASVFYNRLAINMPLQSDATTAYVIGADPKPEDLKIEGPYNTYLNHGLPAGPICSPGLACLQAVCAPEKTKYYYFYFAEQNGKMVYSFSENYEDHKGAIAAS